MNTDRKCDTNCDVVSDRPLSPIEEQIAKQRAAISDLHSVIDAVEKQLAPVLRIVPQCSDKNEGTHCTPVRSAVASALSDNGDGITSAARRLHELAGRLDV